MQTSIIRNTKETLSKKLFIYAFPSPFQSFPKPLVHRTRRVLLSGHFDNVSKCAHIFFSPVEYEILYKVI